MLRKNKQTKQLRQSNIRIFQLFFLAWGLNSRKQNPYIWLHFGICSDKPDWVKWLLIKSKRKQHKDPKNIFFCSYMTISSFKLYICIWVRNTVLPGNNYRSDSTAFIGTKFSLNWWKLWIRECKIRLSGLRHSCCSCFWFTRALRCVLSFQRVVSYHQSQWKYLQA